jgi:hypothetical protein
MTTSKVFEGAAGGTVATPVRVAGR